ncbi:MAG: competence/damage-inducible protein A [Polaromonas sp.]|nr:MAG: competence/damage-inducible protein A [Polaromonas sp.]
MQNFGIIIIGDEILSGKRADKHLPKAIELLKARGLALSYADYVGDDPARITATLARAFAAARASGDVVFSCGGIGATPDDHTRQCAAAALGVELALHPEAKALIISRMQDVAKEQGVAFEPDRPDNIHRLDMGVFPMGAQIIPNPYNKIPGFSCFVERDVPPTQQGPQDWLRQTAGAAAPSGGRELHAVNERGGLHFLPGFPVMAWPMIEWVLDTHYPHLHQTSAYIEKSIIVFGSMEATLTPLMVDIEASHPGIKVFSLPSVDHATYGRHIELGVKGAPDAVALAYAALLAGLGNFDYKLGPELVR